MWTMTREQAVELVLAGPQWGTCRHCDGGLAESVPVKLEGTSLLTAQPSEETVMARVRCSVCNGRGVFLKKNWYTARKLLELPWEVPIPPKECALVVIRPNKLESITRVTIPKKYNYHFDRMRSLMDPNPRPVLWCLDERLDP